LKNSIMPRCFPSLDSDAYLFVPGFAISSQ
jgi:hypothetical protein